MIELVPMTSEEYEAFIVISMRDHAQGQVQAGAWRAEEADRNIEMLRGQLLPAGLATPDHFFFTIKEAGARATVGGLWYMVEEEEGQRQFFVMDIQVYDAYRRRGYGSQAFEAMEQRARELCVDRISLHVFRHNHPARAMYEKLGYSGTDTILSKEITDLGRHTAAA